MLTNRRPCPETKHNAPPATPPDVASGGRELGPVLGVAFRVLTHHAAVDGVALDQTAQARRLVGAVEQDAPRRTAAQAVPGELRRRVADREPDRPAGDRERLGLVDLRL